MTNKKAIDLLDNLIGMVDDNHDSDYDTALKMAINSLKQEPCDDCVSREAVLDALKKCEPLIDYDEHDRRETYYEAEEVEFKIGLLPPVYPQNTDVLDKIRAEIEQNAYPIVHGVNNHELGMTLYGILQVIDKYKAGEEE